MVDLTTLGVGVAIGEAGKEVAKAALVPPAKEVGDVLGRLTRSVLAPFRAMAWGFERIEDWIEKDVRKRLEGVPPEQIQEPAPEVVVPALMAVAYTRAEDLRDLFANLIARSMDKETAGKVHPSFVEVIRQLTPGEARILRAVEPAPVTFYSFPFDDTNEYSVSPFGDLGVTRLFEMAGGDFSGGQDQVAIDNLRRLKLVYYTDEDASFSESESFEEIPDFLPLTSAQLSLLKVSFSQQPFIHADIRRLALTSFGKNFCAVCLNKPSVDGRPSTPP